MDQTPFPYLTRSLPAQFWHRCMECSNVWVSTKSLITEEIWPGQGLNLGLPSDTPALYPLLQELMLKSFYFSFSILFSFSVATCDLFDKMGLVFWESLNHFEIIRHSSTKRPILRQTYNFNNSKLQLTLHFNLQLQQIRQFQLVISSYRKFRCIYVIVL
jgi:hypothetical protein